MPVALAFLAVSLIGTQQASSARKSASRERTAAREEQQAQVENTNRQNRIGQIKKARQASANTRNLSENVGAATSSSASAAAGNPFTQVAASFGFQNQQLGSQRRANEHLASASSFENRALSAGAMAGIGMQAFGASGGFKGVFKSASQDDVA
jgi:hypothetical protein